MDFNTTLIKLVEEQEIQLDENLIADLKKLGTTALAVLALGAFSTPALGATDMTKSYKQISGPEVKINKEYSNLGITPQEYAKISTMSKRYNKNDLQRGAKSIASSNDIKKLQQQLKQVSQKPTNTIGM